MHLYNYWNVYLCSTQVLDNIVFIWKELLFNLITNKQNVLAITHDLAWQSLDNLLGAVSLNLFIVKEKKIAPKMLNSIMFVILMGHFLGSLIFGT